MSPWREKLQVLFQELKPKLPEMGRFGLIFAKNPIQSMRSLPDWDWPQILAAQAALASLTGFLGGVIGRQIGAIIFGPLIAPIANLLMSVIFSGVIFYTFLFVVQREVSFRKIFLNVFFASLPTLIISSLTSLVPALILVGFAASLMLLMVGLVDNFQLPREPAKKVLIAIYALFCIFWIASSIRFHRSATDFSDKTTPESLDILEKELNL